MGYEEVDLLERAFIEKSVDALARGEFATLVLRINAALAAAQPGLLFLAGKLIPFAL